MASFFGNIAKNNTDINDQIIAENMLSSATGAANAYLNATMVCTTPELRAMCSSSLTQVITGHSAVTELAIKRGWENPYNPPAQQLADAYTNTKSTIQSDDK